MKPIGINDLTDAEIESAAILLFLKRNPLWHLHYVMASTGQADFWEACYPEQGMFVRADTLAALAIALWDKKEGA